MKDGILPEKQLSRGKIDIELQGVKLRGGFSLVRTSMRSARAGRKKGWLLIKHRDEYADWTWNIENPRLDYSVLTGESMKEITSGRPRRTAHRRLSRAK